MIRTLAVFSACTISLAGLGTAIAAPSAGSTTLSPVDYAFIGSTYLGNQYQVDTGKLGETHALHPAVKDYAQLMDTSHVEVQSKLVGLLKKKGLTQPTLTLLQGAYASVVQILSDEKGPAFERDYVSAQVHYQHSNDALYRWEIANGKDPALIAYAKVVLPKVDDHLDRAEKLAATTR